MSKKRDRQTRQKKQELKRKKRIIRLNRNSGSNKKSMWKNMLNKLSGWGSQTGRMNPKVFKSKGRV